jgi:hypothetical protein
MERLNGGMINGRSGTTAISELGMLGAHIFVQCSFVGGPAHECPTRHFALCFTPVRNLISRTVETAEKLETKKCEKSGAMESWSNGVLDRIGSHRYAQRKRMGIGVDAATALMFYVKRRVEPHGQPLTP